MNLWGIKLKSQWTYTVTWCDCNVSSIEDHQVLKYQLSQPFKALHQSYLSFWSLGAWAHVCLWFDDWYFSTWWLPMPLTLTIILNKWVDSLYFTYQISSDINSIIDYKPCHSKDSVNKCTAIRAFLKWKFRFPYAIRAQARFRKK